MIKKRTKNSAAGFTIIEMLVGAAVFLIIMTAVAGVFSGTVRQYRDVRAMQQGIESGENALTLVAKVIRTSVFTSSIPTSDGDKESIHLYDYSQVKCVSYRFANNTLEWAEKSAPGGPADCSSVPMAWKKLTNTYTVGKFIVKNPPRNVDVAAPGTSANVPRVTVAMTVYPQRTTGSTASSERYTASLQTTTSMRNYAP